MTKQKIISGIILLIIVVAVLVGIVHYKESQSAESSIDSSISTKASIKPYSHAGTTNNDAGSENNSMGLGDHFGKAMEHIGL